MKNGDNKGIIILMGVIIIILVVLCVLFATNTITFNNSSIKNNTNNRLSNDNKSEDDEKKDLYVIKYEEETYTTKNKDNIENTKSKRNIVTIESKNNPNAASLMENKLNDISNSQWEDIRKNADESYENSSTGLGVNYLIKTGVVTNNRLTFLISTEGSFGGVSWDSNEGYNFDATTGNLLKLDDIGDGVLDYIYNQSISQIEKDNNDSSCLEIDWKDKVKVELNKNGNWYFATDGIKVIFPKYSIACGAGGSKIIDFNKSDINFYLDDKYKIK